MVNIEYFNKMESTLGLMQNLPKNLLGKLGINFGIDKGLGNTIEVTIISGDTPENVRRIVEDLGGQYEDLGYGFGLVEIDIQSLPMLASSQSIQYIELPKQLYTTDRQSNRAAIL